MGTVAAEALLQIQNIYHTDNSLLKLPPSERKKHRTSLVKPLVDAFFEQQMAFNTASIRRNTYEYFLRIHRYHSTTT